jgi:4-hydroxy-3-polyprenylbenzoate decarboxylase
MPHDILVEIANLPGTKKVKIFICLDSGTDLNDTFLLTWLCLGNTDPVRDYIITAREPDGINCILIDATSKTKNIHSFKRPWPNIVTSSENTIEKVDHKWKELFDTDSIPSPSLNFIKTRLYAGSTAFSNK